MAGRRTATKDVPAAFAVADAYKGYRSFLAGGVEIPVEDGKVAVSEEFAEALRKRGYLK